ncbi:MAG: endonuclease domain-containing protein [Rhizobiaceae bacterium]
MAKTRVTPELREKAKSLRHSMTRSEVLLWPELRELKRDGLHFRKQAPIGPYVVDFVCLGSKLIVEVDGDHHEIEREKRRDSVRDAYLRSLGYEVLRIDYPDVLGNGSAWNVAQSIKYAALGRFDPTRPLRGHPPLKGEGAP